MYTLKYQINNRMPFNKQYFKLKMLSTENYQVEFLVKVGDEGHWVQ